MNKTALKKIACFLGICCWGVGAIGGFGYAAYAHAWFIAVCVAFLAVLSFDRVRDMVRYLVEA